MELSGLERQRTPAGNTATGWLKIIALIFMVIDHIGVIFFPDTYELRVLGRIAFPLYAWCLVVGFYYTHSVPKYMLRLAFVGVISQPLYVLAIGHPWAKPNIFLTLLMGLAVLWAIREKWHFSQFWAPTAAILLATLLDISYGWKGIAFIVLLYEASGSMTGLAAVMVAFFLYWGTGYPVTTSLFGIPIHMDMLPEFLRYPLSAFLRLQTYGLLSLPFILIPFRKDLRLPSWLGYAVYPAHLLVLLLVKAAVLR
ncbi:MAG: conjugal transfer protein TraX [Oscillospiraceae bacterium]|nr:conjugal transfer protein TraX [Oscillospiraceae bacterium]